MGSDAPLLDDSTTGMPVIAENEKVAGEAKARMAITMFSVVPAVIGASGAYAIYAFGSYAGKIAVLKDGDLGYLYLAGWLYGRVVGFLNKYPMVAKARVVRGDSGNLRANMQIYKQIGEKAMPNAIVLETDGDVGAYNRANRSLQHFVETTPDFIVALGLAGYVFPKPTLALTALFGLGRFLHMTGYQKGYGKHAPGFAIASLTSEILGGLVLVAAVASFA
mmetsp:Transcript_6862/g.22795  ORF Transcript_6862/g.22795 Transcript_6862/m.22795 type:complete len:221 (+) Transcript_6862:186-848(+)